MKLFKKKVIKVKQPLTAARQDPPVRFPWQRLTLSLIGIFFIFVMWRWSVNHLYSLPQYTLDTFQAITNSCIYSLSALVVWFVTGRLVTDLKSSATAQIIETATDTIKPASKPIAPKHVDDGTIS